MKKSLTLFLIIAFLFTDLTPAAAAVLRASRQRRQVIDEEPAVRRGGAQNGAVAQVEAVEAQEEIQNLIDAIVPAQAPSASYSPTEAAQYLSQNSDPTTGLITSYPQAPGLENQAFTYDQAVAALSLVDAANQASAAGNTVTAQVYLLAAQKIFVFYHSKWDGHGFKTVYNGLDPANTVESTVTMGPNAWLGLFFTKFYAATGNQAAFELAEDIAMWIGSLPSSTNATGGLVRAQGEGSAIFSVEENLDYYALLANLTKLMSPVSPNRTAFLAESAKVENWLTTTAFNSAVSGRNARLFNRGAGDSTPALDVNTWAIMALGIDKVKTVVGGTDAELDAFIQRIESTFAVKRDGLFGGTNLSVWKGFDFSDSTNAGSRPGSKGLVWVEGTAQMIAVYDMLRAYYLAKGDTPRANFYTARRDHFKTEILAYTDTTPQGQIGLKYTDTPGVRAFADINFILSPGVAAASTAWTYLALKATNPFTNVPTTFPVSGITAVQSFGQALKLSPQRETIEILFNSILPLGIPPGSILWNLDDGVNPGDETLAIIGSNLVTTLIEEGALIRPQPLAPILAVIDFVNVLNARSDRSTLINYLNTIYGINILDSATGRASLSKITIDEYTDLVTMGIIYDRNGNLVPPTEFFGFLFDAVTLDQAVSAGHRARFEALFGVLQADQVISNATYREQIFSIVGTPDRADTSDINEDYVLANFMAIMPKTADLLIALRAGSVPATADLNNDGIVDRADIAVIASNLGMTSASRAQGDLTGDGRVGVIDISALQRQFGSVGTPSDAVVAFNILFPFATLRAGGRISDVARIQLFAIAGTPDKQGTPENEAYDQTKFFNAMVNARALLAVIRPNTALRNDINALYGLNISSNPSQMVSEDMRTALFGITGRTGYTQAAFLDFMDAIQDYRAYYNSLSAVQKLNAERVLEALGVDLDNGLDSADLLAFSDPERGILYNGAQRRNIPEAFAFYFVVEEYLKAFDRLITDLINFGETQATYDCLDIVIAQETGLTFTYQRTLPVYARIDATDMRAFGDPNRGILYDEQGNKRDFDDSMDFFYVLCF